MEMCRAEDDHKQSGSLPSCDAHMACESETKKQALLDNLRAEASKKGLENILESYSDNYLMLLLNSERDASIDGTLQRLEHAFECRLELQEMERKMDGNLFVKLVTDGGFMCSGTERGTGQPIFWIRSAAACHNCWKYKVGTSKYLAFVRANVWLFEIANMTVCLSQYERPLYYVAMQNQGLLDFNVSGMTEIVRLCKGIFPLSREKLRVAGLSKVAPVVGKLVLRVMGPRAKNVSFMSADEVYDLVEDARDIPQYWSGDRSHKPYRSDDRRNVWCYERCLSDENKVTQRDIFNPDAWYFEEFDYSSSPRCLLDEREWDTLSVIEEEGE